MSRVVNRVLPAICVMCHQLNTNGQNLCHYCLQLIPRIACACRLCAAPLGIGKRCAACDSNTLPYKYVFAPYLYKEPIDQFINHLKFSRSISYANVLGELLAHSIYSEYINDYPEVIIPVPLHQNRLRQRGFNQSLEIARLVSKRLDIPIDYHCAKRIKNTAAQATLSQDKRHKNIQNAFSVKKPRQNHIVLLDDVITTGATTRELARQFCQKGVGIIGIWAVAKAAWTPKT